MSQAIQEPVVPRGGVLAAAALCVVLSCDMTTVRLTGMGEVHMTLPAAVQSRDLQFADGDNGTVLI